jgi:pimeloyl-ACP methyl ester carboxylesterase
VVNIAHQKSGTIAVPMNDIFKWSSVHQFACERRVLPNHANHRKNSYFVLSQPNPEMAANQKNLMLVLHGTGNDAWFPQIEMVRQSLKRGFTVVAANLPGHGAGDASLLDCDDLGSFVDQLISDVEREMNFHNIFLWGHSLGAAAIIELLTMHATRRPITGAILVAMPTQPRLSLAVIASELILPFLKTFWQLRATYGFLGTFPAFGRFKRQQFPIRLDPKYQCESCIKVVSNWYAQRDWLQQCKTISIPILLIHGGLDLLAPRSVGHQLCSTIQRAELEFLRWENHFTLAGSPETAELSVAWTQKFLNAD